MFLFRSRPWHSNFIGKIPVPFSEAGSVRELWPTEDGFALFSEMEVKITFVSLHFNTVSHEYTYQYTSLSLYIYIYTYILNLLPFQTLKVEDYCCRNSNRIRQKTFTCLQALHKFWTAVLQFSPGREHKSLFHSEKKARKY